MIELNTVYNENCLIGMSRIADKSVDMILCDLPYGTTKNKWDSVIPFEPLWEHYNRIIKPNGAIVLTAQSPFDKVLGCSNIEDLKYEWIWEKPQGSGHLNSKFAPLKSHENILVFSKASASFVKDISNSMVYNPQMEAGTPYVCKSGKASKNYDHANMRQVITSNDGERYPKTVLKFSKDKDKIHPTQKPVALFEYLIRTYTNKGETVLDNCMGSWTTAVACINTNRNYIGFELDEEYFRIGKERVEKYLAPKIIVPDLFSIAS